MKKNIVIYPHNKRAYEKVCAAFEESNRTCVIHPTGTGKMYVALQLIDANADKAILYLTSYSPILTALAAEMEKCGVATDNLTMGLYASLDAAAVDHHYDYIILDEFHRAGAEVWGSWISKLLENNPQAKILGLSATPIRYLDNNRDMSDELFDGNIASSMTLAEAVGTGILKMPRYVCAVYSLSQELERYSERVHNLRSDNNKTEALALLEKARRSLEQADGLSKIFADNMTVKDGRYIIFCRNFEHMESMQMECKEWLRDVNSKVKMYELRSTLPEAINQQTLLTFNKDKSKSLKLLFAVDMLNEGVHASNVDGCIMLRPTESMNVFLQQLGRAISVGSKAQTVVFDIVNNSAQLNAFGSFKSEVERVVAETGSGVVLEDFEIHESLRNFFDIISQIDICVAYKRWDEWYAIAQNFYQEHGHLLVKQLYKTPAGEALGLWISNQRMKYQNGTLPIEQQTMLNLIGMAWNAVDAEWERMYAYAKAFYEENGHTHVAYSIKVGDGKRLSSWINGQKMACKNGIISAERQARLEAIGIIWNERDLAWDQMLNYARSYYNKFGHLRVEYTYKTEDGKNLGYWISDQRKDYKSGKLASARIAALEAIGMVWNALDAVWERMYAYAKEYYIENKHLLIPGNYKTPDGAKLGIWLINLRQAHKEGSLSADRIAQLESIGMCWNHGDTVWEQMFSQAKAFFEKNGHLRVPEDAKTATGQNLNLWLGTQRKIYKSGRLSSDKQKRLQDIGIIWSTEEDAWTRMLAHAQNYFSHYGDLRIPDAYVTEDGAKLGRWISTQRTKYKSGKLPADRIAALEAIGMIWNTLDAAWDQMYAWAKEYYNQHSNLRIPVDYKTANGLRLGSWLHNQRQLYKKGKLPAERQTRLEAIGMAWRISPKTKNDDQSN